MAKRIRKLIRLYPKKTVYEFHIYESGGGNEN